MPCNEDTLKEKKVIEKKTQEITEVKGSIATTGSSPLFGLDKTDCN